LREVAVEPGAEQPEAQADLVLYAEVIPGGPSVFAPPGAFDTLGAFDSDYFVQRAPPSEAQRRPIWHFRHRLDWLRPRQQPQWARRKLYLLAISAERMPTSIAVGGLCGESGLGYFRNVAVLSG